MAAVVLVHGAFADGSGWRAVHDTLRSAGHTVVATQHPTISLADDVAVVRRVLDQHADVVLVGHSYGGAVITAAGTHPHVKALVYVAAFAPDTGESAGSLQATVPADAPQPPVLAPVEGFLLLDPERFPESFAADVDDTTATFMAHSQLPWGLDAAGGVVDEPAWRTRPAWYLLATADKMIAPSLQRTMSARAGATVVEIDASHAVYVSHPDAVADLVSRADQDL